MLFLGNVLNLTYVEVVRKKKKKKKKKLAMHQKKKKKNHKVNLFSGCSKYCLPEFSSPFL